MIRQKSCANFPYANYTGAPFSTAPDANPGIAIELPLTGFSVEQRTGYGWAIGGVDGNGQAGYVSITELRAYGVESPDKTPEGVRP